MHNIINSIVAGYNLAFASLPEKILYFETMASAEIKTPLPLVYAHEGKVVATPYYIESLKGLIVGIKVNEFVVCKDQSVNNWLVEGKQLLKDCSLGGVEADFPSVEEFAELEARSSDFNETIKILQNNGVPADCLKLRGEYWTADVCAQDEAILYDFCHHNEKAGYILQVAAILLVWHLPKSAFETE